MHMQAPTINNVSKVGIYVEIGRIRAEYFIARKK